MKKSKAALVVLLTAALILSAVSVPTFSWFTRPRAQTGNSVTYSDTVNAYNAYHVTMTTQASADNTTYSDVTDSAGLSGSGIGAESRKYYRTVITNESGTTQNVSLYISKISIPTANNGNFCLGVNGPTRSFRDYTALSAPNHMAEGNVKRVYLETTNNVQGWQGNDFYVCWGTRDLGTIGSTGTYYHMSQIDNTEFFYADIPDYTTNLFFSVANWGTNNNGSPDYSQRTPQWTNLGTLSKTQAKVYKVINEQDNGNTKVQAYDVTGACFLSYYSDFFVAAGNTFDASLTAGAANNYVGSGAWYYSSDTSVFTVNETTGVVSGVAAGTATLYTKIKGGSYNDYKQVETRVTVTGGSNYEFSDIAVAKNMEIPAEEGKNTVVVNWYIMNPKGSQNNLSYTIDGIYLGL